MNNLVGTGCHTKQVPQQPGETLLTSIPTLPPVTASETLSARTYGEREPGSFGILVIFLCSLG